MSLLRIGVWFNTAHTAYGGPSQVLIGTILGFLQDTDNPPLIMANEPGDVNWILDPQTDWVATDMGTRGLRRAVGPLVFSHADVMIDDPNTSPVWCLGNRQITLYLAPSLWFGKWISTGLPFHDVQAHRPMVVWGAGVNTDFFRPLTLSTPAPTPTPTPTPKHDYFIYFKSQNWTDLREVHEYLFKNYFRMHGPTLMYYFYSHEELRDAAQNAAFCILLDATETQGLAALEIMACGCPLFVLDCRDYMNEKYVTHEASSVPCWDSRGRCGMKSSMPKMAEDFPLFLEALEKDKYNPREFVETEYSWSASAKKLRRLLEALPPP